MKHIGKIAIGVAMAAALIGGGVWYAKQRAAQNPETRYKLATLEKGDVTQTVSANGTLNPVVLISVGTQVSGTVKKLYVDFNDKVEAGQKMLELDQQLSHVWMVRTFLKHSDEAAEDEELAEVHRELYDFMLALGPSIDSENAEPMRIPARALKPNATVAGELPKEASASARADSMSCSSVAVSPVSSQRRMPRQLRSTRPTPAMSEPARRHTARSTRQG